MTIDLENVKSICIQFNLSNINAVPGCLTELESETVDQCFARMGNETGSLVIERTERCSLENIMIQLKNAGFFLAKGTHQERININSMSDKTSTYQMVRFIFKRKADYPEEYNRRDINLMKAIRQMCRTALWRVRAYLNPIQGDNEHCQVSINLEVRVPIFLPNNKPILVWLKDRDGNRVGDAPQPIQPQYILSVENGAIVLKQCEQVRELATV